MSKWQDRIAIVIFIIILIPGIFLYREYLKYEKKQNEKATEEIYQRYKEQWRKEYGEIYKEMCPNNPESELYGEEGCYLYGEHSYCPETAPVDAGCYTTFGHEHEYCPND